MRRKTYLPPLLTALLILLGASMPWLAARIQDAGIRGVLERTPLSSVSLTLLEENHLSAVLGLASREYTLLPWGEDTAMTAQEAAGRALETVRCLEEWGPLPVDSAVLLAEAAEQAASPALLVAEDGGSALVWECRWTGEAVPACSMLVDDATGKAVCLTVDGVPEDGSHGELEQWLAFLQAYYGAAVEPLDMDVIRTDYGEWVEWFSLSLSFGDGTEPCRLELCFYEGVTLFNQSLMLN